MSVAISDLAARLTTPSKNAGGRNPFAGGGRSSRVHREIAPEYRNAPQNNPLDFRQQIVAPVQCRAHTLLDPLLPPFRVEGLATACGSFAQPYAQLDALTE
jgi:hypothetical protein